MKNVQLQYQSTLDRNIPSRNMYKRLIGGGMITFAMTLSFAGVAQAQKPAKPQNVVAISGGIVTKSFSTDGKADNKVHVSWANSNPANVDLYLIRFSDGTKHRVCDTGNWARPNWVTCDHTVDFNNGASRISYTHDQGNITSVQVNAVEIVNNGKSGSFSGFSNSTTVTDGVPRNLVANRTAQNTLEVMWEPNPDTLDEPIANYEVRTRPNTWVKNLGKAFRTSNTNGTITLVTNHRSKPNQARIRVEYETLGITVYSDWVDETIPSDTTHNHVVSPVAATGPVAVTGDLTNQCRDDNDPGTTNVFDRINGHARGPYPEDRIPLETHVWFFPTTESVGGLGSGKTFGHAHLLTCVPHTALGSDSVITSSNLRLDFEIQAHLHPAKRLDGTDLEPANDIQVRIDQIEIRARNGSGKDILIDRDSFAEFRCNPGEECIYQQTMDVELSNSDDANGFLYNGVKELRIAALHDIYHNGEFVAKKRAIMRHPIELNIPGYTNAPSSNSISNFNTTITESSGWLIEDQKPGVGGYATVGIQKFNNEVGMLPIAPISKNDDFEFSLRLEADPCVQNCDVRHAPLTRVWAFIDPNFHAHSMDGHGLNGDAICADGTSSGCRAFKIDLDENKITSFVTRSIDISDLEPGMHQLLLAVEQPMVHGDGPNEQITDNRFQSTLTGLLIIRFIVTD